MCDVIKIKMESYVLMKSKGQTAEEYLKEFLENEIRVIWPKGWMQSRYWHYIFIYTVHMCIMLARWLKATVICLVNTTL